VKFHVWNYPIPPANHAEYVFENAYSPAHLSESIYWKHKYSADTTLQAVVNVIQDWKCSQHAIAHACSFDMHFCWSRWSCDLAL